jgi:hypothetical protein
MERTAPGDMTATAERLVADVVEDLKAFEFAARRALEGDDGRPRAVRPDEVPPGWKELVERYYEELAR